MWVCPGTGGAQLSLAVLLQALCTPRSSPELTSKPSGMAGGKPVAGSPAPRACLAAKGGVWHCEASAGKHEVMLSIFPCLYLNCQYLLELKLMKAEPEACRDLEVKQQLPGCCHLLLLEVAPGFGPITAGGGMAMTSLPWLWADGAAGAG